MGLFGRLYGENEIVRIAGNYANLVRFFDSTRDAIFDERVPIDKKRLAVKIYLNTKKGFEESDIPQRLKDSLLAELRTEFTSTFEDKVREYSDSSI